MTDTANSKVELKLANGIAYIVMDDGKNNVISPAMLSELNRALDQAEAAGAVVVLTGRDGIFSAGFDLNILKTGVSNALGMLLGGFKLARRLLAFPRPVVIACNGHAIAMGSFLLLSADYRLGTRGEFKIVANEVKIGMTMPHTAIALCRERLTPAHFDRAVLLSEEYNPESAIAAGFLDEVVAADQLETRARECAEEFAALSLKAHTRTKLRVRRQLIKSLAWAIHKDRADFISMGIRRVLGMS